MRLAVLSPWNSTGYGVAGIALSYNLLLRDRVSVLSHLGPVEHTADDEKVMQMLMRTMMNPVEVDLSLPALKFAHQHQLFSMPTRGCRIGWTVFEVELTEFEVANMNSCDVIIVCSNWARELAKSCGVTVPIRVVSLGVSARHYVPSPPPRGDVYTFLTVGKWEVRKGHPELARTFSRTFQGVGDVELIMAVDNPFLPPLEMAKIKDHHRRLHPGIRFVSRMRHPRMVAELMRSTHCGVFPTKSEGFGLPLVEMMACNRMVIAPQTTALADYVTNDNAIVLETTTTEPAEDGVFFNRGEWYAVDPDELAAAMLEAYKERKCANPGGVETAKRLSWHNVTEKLLQVLEEEDVWN
jgi:glycosyltransferase involved in cell wall biosynthesis